MPNLAENCYPTGMNTPKWLQWAGIAVVVAVIVLFSAGIASAATKWAPDKGFARLVHTAYGSKGVKLSQVVCMKPVLPPNAAMTVGIADEDCLAIGLKGKKAFCFELLYSGGASRGQELDCADLRRVLKTKVDPATILHWEPAVAKGPVA